MFRAALDSLADRGRLIVIGMMGSYAEGWPLSTHPGLTEKLLWKSASVVRRAFRGLLALQWTSFCYGLPAQGMGIVHVTIVCMAHPDISPPHAACCCLHPGGLLSPQVCSILPDSPGPPSAAAGLGKDHRNHRPSQARRLLASFLRAQQAV